MSEEVNLLQRRKPTLSRGRRLRAQLGRFIPKPLRFAVGMTITECLEAATSEEEIRELLRNGNNQRPSGATRREWLRIAKAKRKSLS